MIVRMRCSEGDLKVYGHHQNVALVADPVEVLSRPPTPARSDLWPRHDSPGASAPGASVEVRMCSYPLPSMLFA